MSLYIPTTAELDWSYQDEAVTAVLDHFDAGNRRALFTMATGLGKTRTAAEIAKRLFDEGRVNRFALVSHRQDISLQAIEEFREVFGDALDPGLFLNGIKDQDHQHIFGLFQSLHLEMMKPNAEYSAVTAPGAFDLVIVDEAHHTPAQTFAAVFGKMHPALALGMTATPRRMDGISAAAYFGSSCFDLDYEMAIGRGLAVPIDYHVMGDELTTEAFDAGNLGSRFDQGSRTRRSLDPTRAARLVQECRLRVGDNPATLVFVNNVDVAHATAKKLEGAIAVTGKDSIEFRQHAYSDFDRGKYNTIVAVGVLDEGVNVPRADVAAIFGGSRSETRLMHRIGRVTRRRPGKDKAFVFDFPDSAEHIKVVQRVAESYGAQQINESVDSTKRTTGLVVRWAPEARDFAAILEQIKASNRYDADEIVNWVINFTESAGKLPTARDAERFGFLPSIVRTVGGITDAIQLAGYEPIGEKGLFNLGLLREMAAGYRNAGDDESASAAMANIVAEIGPYIARYARFEAKRSDCSVDDLHSFLMSRVITSVAAIRDRSLVGTRESVELGGLTNYSEVVVPSARFDRLAKRGASAISQFVRREADAFGTDQRQKGMVREKRKKKEKPYDPPKEFVTRLDAPRTEDLEDSTWVDAAENLKADVFDKRFADAAGLDSRERLILALRFWNGMTFEEIGRQAGGLSGTRVNQLEARALSKIRVPVRPTGIHKEDAEGVSSRPVIARLEPVPPKRVVNRFNYLESDDYDYATDSGAMVERHREYFRGTKAFSARVGADPATIMTYAEFRDAMEFAGRGTPAQRSRLARSAYMLIGDEYWDSQNGWRTRIELGGGLGDDELSDVPNVDEPIEIVAERQSGAAFAAQRAELGIRPGILTLGTFRRIVVANPDMPISPVITPELSKTCDFYIDVARHEKIFTKQLSHPQKVWLKRRCLVPQTPEPISAQQVVKIDRFLRQDSIQRWSEVNAKPLNEDLAHIASADLIARARAKTLPSQNRGATQTL